MRFLVAALLLVAAPAVALPPWMEDGKAGRWEVDATGGAGVYRNADGHPFAAGSGGVTVGIAFGEERRFLLVAPVQVLFTGVAATLVLPVGAQYDFRLLPGLYLFPRLSLGYALVIPWASDSDVHHAGAVIPEVGVKLVVRKKWNLGAAFSFPIVFGQVITSDGTVWDGTVHYRLLGFAGVDF